MKIFRYALFSALFLFTHAPISAEILEVRAGFGVASADPDAFNQDLGPGAGDVLATSNLNSYNVDLFVNIPISPIGVGVRYETANDDNDLSINGTSLSSELDVEIISLLVDWRFIDTVAYVGPIISVGQASGDLDVTTSGTTTSFDLDGDGLAWSVGGEAGVRLKGFIVGAEAGYRSLPLEKSVDVDLDGLYGKIMIGLAFL